MENQIEKVNPVEFGLQESQVVEIEQAFMPKIVERDALKSVYEGLLTKEITPELCREAKEVRLKLVKVRTGIADIHKTQKAFFLAAGRFVDAWKNKETLPIEQMEENLKLIETHYEKIEAERIQKLEAERKELVLKFTEFPASNLALMTEDVFNAYLKGVELAYNAKIEEERKAEELRIETEKKAKLHEERKQLALPFYEFWTDFEKSLNFGEQSESDFNNFIDRIKKAKADKDLQIEAQRKENERLKIEAEVKKVRDEKRNKELRPYIIFIRDYDKMLNMPEAEYQKEFIDIKKGAEDHWEFERKEQIRKQAEQKAQELALQEAQSEKAKLEAELKAKAEAEEKARKEAEAKAIAEQKAKEAAAAAPDKEKIITAVNSIKFELPECKSEQMQSVANTINQKFEAFKKWAIEQTNNL